MATPPSTASTTFSFLALALLVVATPASLAGQDNQAHHLRFYIHDKISGPNVTAVKVAADPSFQRPSATGLYFSSVYVIDDLVTEGPGPTSKPVGRARGFYTVSSMDGSELYFSVQVSFTEGAYKGSSIAISGGDPIMEEVRELPVIGGNGRFRLARGFVLMQTHSFDTATGDAVLLLNAYILNHH